MPALSRPKWEIFAQNTAIGLTPKDSIASAGYKSRNPSKSASDLLKVPQISARVAELLEERRVRTAQIDEDRTTDSILNQDIRLKEKLNRFDGLGNMLVKIDEELEILTRAITERAAYYAAHPDPKVASVPGILTGRWVMTSKTLGLDKDLMSERRMWMAERRATVIAMSSIDVEIWREQGGLTEAESGRKNGPFGWVSLPSDATC